MATTLQLNQRIVYAGLARMSDDRNTVKSAFSHWNEHFSNAPLDIFETVAELVDYLGLGVAEKKGLMIGLHTASAQLYDDLKPVPRYILSEQNQSGQMDESPSAATEPKKIAPHLEVSARYLQLVSLQVKRSDSPSHKELVKAVAKEGLAIMPKVVSEWASDGLNIIKLPSTTSVQECQDLAHEFYVMVCDFIGPVESDRIVNRVITELSSLASSRDFDPRDLL